MKKRNSIALLFILLTILLMGGCGWTSEIGADSSSEPVEDTASTTEPVNAQILGNEENNHQSTVDLDICGEYVTFPCKVNELGANVVLKEGLYFEDQDYTLYYLYTFDENLICTIFLDGKQQSPPSDCLVRTIIFDNDSSLITLAGFQGASEATFIEELGVPDIYNEGYIEYNSGNILLSVLFDDENGLPKHTTISLLE